MKTIVFENSCEESLGDLRDLGSLIATYSALENILFFKSDHYDSRVCDNFVVIALSIDKIPSEFKMSLHFWNLLTSNSFRDQKTIHIDRVHVFEGEPHLFVNSYVLSSYKEF